MTDLEHYCSKCRILTTHTIVGSFGMTTRTEIQCEVCGNRDDIELGGCYDDKGYHGQWRD